MRSLVLIPALVLAAAGAAGAATPVRENPATPAEGRVTVALQPQWTLGGEDDDEHFFGIVGEVFADEAGNVFLVDNQLSEVQVYDPAGAHLGTLGRRGDGPGEVRNLRTALLMPDGSVGLVQAFPGQVVCVGRDGQPGTTLVPGRSDPTAGGFMALNTALARGGTLAFSGSRMQRREQTALRANYLATFAPDGAERGAILVRESEMTMGSPKVSEAEEDFPNDRWAIGPDGNVYVAPERNGYRIDVHAPDGTLLRSFGRAYEPVRRTAQEKDEVKDTLQPWRRRGREQMEFTILDTEPDIVRLHVLPGGEVWVLTSRGLRERQPGEMAVYDVFDAEGRFVRQAGLACDGDPRRDALFPVGADRWILVRGHAEALRSLFGMMGDGGEPSDTMLEIVSFRAAR
ncbi:MAG TPA: hypothetical protein PLQ13_08315 [Candidatus Krumholzibacteria bacterium]|nr:hypothetical protein [Candidatus Krumholzibacteria bacterium]